MALNEFESVLLYGKIFWGFPNKHTIFSGQCFRVLQKTALKTAWGLNGVDILSRALRDKEGINCANPSSFIFLLFFIQSYLKTCATILFQYGEY